MTYTVNVYHVGCDKPETWGTDLNFRAANDLFDHIVDEEEVRLTDDVALINEDYETVKFYNFEDGNIIYTDEFYELIKWTQLQ